MATKILIIIWFCKTTDFAPKDHSLTLMGGNAARDVQQEHGLQRSPNLSFQILLEEIPNQTKTNHEIAVRIIGSSVKFVACKTRVEMLGFEKNSGLSDARIDKEIEHWKTTYFFIILNE